MSTATPDQGRGQAYRPDLPALPSGIARLPVDSRGFPVPWFVQWLKGGEPTDPGVGEPDFRVADPGKFARALKQRRCWCCGDTLGVHLAFVIGPMCAITRTTSEPPNHLACAEFSTKACPFLTRPRMRRNDKGLPADHFAPGMLIERNPGVACVWITKSYTVFPSYGGGPGVLLQVGEPERVLWFAEGREAAREQVMASIDSGLPILYKEAERDGAEAVAELEGQMAAIIPLLPGPDLTKGGEPQ